MFIFIRVLPVISIAEMRELVHETTRGAPGSSHAAAETPTMTG
jgi:hypothetical protein